MDLSALRAEVHRRCLDMRTMDRLVKTREFEQAFNIDPHNIVITFSVQSGCVEKVEMWIEQTLRREIGELSLRKLRDLASDLGIAFYTSYSKPELIAKILRAKHDRRSQEVALGMSSESGRQDSPVPARSLTDVSHHAS